VTTHSIAVVAAIPAMLGGFAAIRSESLPLGFLYVACGVLMMALVQTFLIPLVAGDA
jgi:hypothetical protein